MTTMKGNKGKDVVSEGDHPEAKLRFVQQLGITVLRSHLRLVRLLGTRGNPYQKTWIWEASPAVVTKELSMDRLK